MQLLRNRAYQLSSIFMKNKYMFAEKKGHHLKEYNVSGVGQSWATTITTEDKFVIQTDAPKKFGGTGLYAQPLHTFLASLIGCEQATSTFIAKQMDVTITKVEYDIKAERDEEGFKHLPIKEDAPVTSAFTRIWGTAIAETSATDEQLKQIESLLKKRCPVARLIVDSGCKLEIEWKKKK